MCIRDRKKAREMGMTQPIIGNNGFNSPAYITQAGAAADGTLVALSLIHI